MGLILKIHGDRLLRLVDNSCIYVPFLQNFLVAEDTGSSLLRRGLHCLSSIELFFEALRLELLGQCDPACTLSIDCEGELVVLFPLLVEEDLSEDDVVSGGVLVLLEKCSVG